jgi:hypothetical protein
MVAVLGLQVLINGNLLIGNGGKASPGYLSLLWFTSVAVVSYIKTKRSAQQ